MVHIDVALPEVSCHAPYVCVILSNKKKVVESVVRLLMVRAFAERRLPLLRRLSSRVWISTEQLARLYYVLKVGSTDLCGTTFITAKCWKRDFLESRNEEKLQV